MVAAKKPQKAPKKRIRRSPEDAKTLILDAADKVFATHLPDTVGLKDVARQAGISHALITHYFGTYLGLIEAALERRFHRVRDELAPQILALFPGQTDARQMLTAHRRAIGRLTKDPSTVRLVIWALLSGRLAADDFFPHRMQGLKLLADALEARSSASREDLEFLLIVSFSLTTTWLFGRKAFLGAMGKKSASQLEEFEEGFDERVDVMIDAFLRTSEAPKGEGERRRRLSEPLR